MTTIVKTIYKFQDKFQRGAERFIFRHPYFVFLAMFMGMPIFILIAVAAWAAIITFPIACFFEWL